MVDFFFFFAIWNALQLEIMILSFIIFVHNTLFIKPGLRREREIRLEICNAQLYLPSRSINEIGSFCVNVM